jgi:glutathione synthase/RimK-type ligase-like ATP-grasp enzyme
LDTKLAMVTGSEWAEWIEEDVVLREALATRGIGAERVVWQDGIEGLSDFDAVLIRSCWDYHEKPEEFEDWLGELDSLSTPVFNDPEILRWNMRKTYLRDLEERGLPVIPTEFLEPHANLRLESLLDRRGWDDVVVKPMIGAGGYRMTRTARERLDRDRESIHSLMNDRGIIIQPYRERIRRDGEWSFVFFGGCYQYTIHKKPPSDDYRAHEKRGATYEPVEPPEIVVDRVRELVDRAELDCLYQRMDGLVLDGSIELMEMECLEPSFYFTHYPEGASSLAKKLAEMIE